MKKSLVAAALLGAIAGGAYAQSNVTIYGVLDLGYVKDNGRDLRMADNNNSRIGFKGTEDLGGGYKALFQLEKRFDVNDGTAGNSNTAGYKGSKSANQKDWDGGANVGIAGPFGTVRAGRMWELTSETIKKFDPFDQLGVGSQIYSLQRAPRIDNTLRYDSPNWNGFSFGASYSLGTNTNDKSVLADVDEDLKQKNADNDGYAVNLSYDNGALFGTANWSRLADSNDSSTWNVGLGYRFTDTFKMTASYEHTKSHGWKGNNGYYDNGHSFKYKNSLEGEQRNLLIGLQWDVGSGTLNASVQWDRLSDYYGANGKAKGEDSAYKYALGYTYNLSKRTSLYGNIAYTDYDSKDMGYCLSGLESESVTSVQLGITHKF